MAFEIEHKYLVINGQYREMAVNTFKICQGYLSRNPDCVVRVRIKGDEGFLTVKGRNFSTDPESKRLELRHEFEYEIPLSDALKMLAMCQGGFIEKTRFIVPFEGHTWEVDEFHGKHEGLIVAEIELPSSDKKYSLPPFVGEDVTGDAKYYNSNL